jgi:hypothetical protein
MKESNTEGVATHGDPESCVGDRAVGASDAGSRDGVNIARHRSTGSSAGEWPAKRAGVGRMANRSPVRRDAAPRTWPDR